MYKVFWKTVQKSKKIYTFAEKFLDYDGKIRVFSRRKA